MGVLLHVDTTGPDPDVDEIIGLTMVRFAYTDTGTLFGPLEVFSEPSAGSVHIDGKPIGRSGNGRATRPMARRELASTRTSIAMVFQHFALWPHLTVLGNVTEAPVHVLGRPKREAEEEGRAILARVGLTEKADVYPHTLSGGQKQRVAISRALAMRPKVILFDEPTSALDPEMVGEVLSVIRELAREGLTMVIVTHEMSFAREIADTIVFMDGGRIREIAAPTDFFTNPQSERARRFIFRP
ncbi:hypothetical protein ADL19_10405 [Streptomyces purpurogeneiscleroticus]|nr:hypothetical protein ADL19_10405 [Streptomyces purpurogeneiscleroticus]